jgi:hypothetical protein
MKKKMIPQFYKIKIKTKVNNPRITSQKGYETGENIQPPFHRRSPSRHKIKENFRVPSPKHMVGQCSKCGLSTQDSIYPYK